MDLLYYALLEFFGEDFRVLNSWICLSSHEFSNLIHKHKHLLDISIKPDAWMRMTGLIELSKHAPAHNSSILVCVYIIYIYIYKKYIYIYIYISHALRDWGTNFAMDRIGGDVHCLE